MNAYLKQLAQQLLPICKNQLLAEQEAWWLLEIVTQKTKHELLLSPFTLTNEQVSKLADLVTQRVQNHKPLQYIAGDTPFCGLTIKVQPPILIPRPETEEWTTWLIEQYKKAKVSKFTAVDLCTGTGCIGLALAKNFPQATVIGIDINPAAIALANENKAINKITNISFVTSDLFSALPSTFCCHMVVSNPPYLTPSEYNQLDPDVRAWEDRAALVGGHDGMLFYHQIFNQIPKLLQPLTPSAQLPNVVLEIGPAQEHQLNQLLNSLSSTTYTIHHDLQGKQRWLAITLPPQHHKN